MPKVTRVSKALMKSYDRPIEHVIDELTNYRLTRIDQIIEEVVQLVKDGEMKLKKTDGGFRFEINKTESYEKGKKTKQV